jgi:hypothetical protein
MQCGEPGHFAWQSLEPTETGHDILDHEKSHLSMPIDERSHEHVQLPGHIEQSMTQIHANPAEKRNVAIEER